MNCVDTALIESFNLDVAYEVDPSTYFEDGNAFMEEVLSEASQPTSKTGVIAKIWAVIKKIFKWIANQWRRFIRWITNLFKRKSKTADQCIEEALGKSASKSRPTGNPTTAGKGNANSIEIAFNPIPLNSKDPKAEQMTAETIKLVYKSLSVKIEGDDVVFYPHQMRDKLSAQQVGKPISRIYVPANVEAPDSYDAMIAIFHMIENPSYQDQLRNIVQMLNNKEWKNGIFGSTDFVNAVNKFTSYFNSYHSVPKSVSLNIKQINEFNSFLTDLNKGLDFYDDPTFVPNNEGVLVAKALNNLATVAYQLQFGINMITGTMSSVHTIDAKYAGCIENATQLGVFVNECIKGNIPSKYIAWNVWAACSDSLKGLARRFAPAMGQSRLVIFPKNDNTVLKIALSQWGVRANNAEYMVSNKLDKVTNAEDLIARTKESYGNAAVIESEKVDTSERPDRSICIDVARRLNEAISKAGLTIDIVDVHGGNVGKRNGKWVVTDYGFTERS